MILEYLISHTTNLEYNKVSANILSYNLYWRYKK